MVKCVDPALIVAPDRFAKVAKRKKSENFGLTKPFMDLKYKGFFFDCSLSTLPTGRVS